MYSCTCVRTSRKISCLHSVEVAIICGTMIHPLDTRVTLLGKRRARGPVWEHHPFNILTPHAHPQQNAGILAGLAPHAEPG